MNKAILVARHEYVETVRTKAFWLGLLAFPIIISLGIAVPLLLEEVKEARRYAVIDHSGFLLGEIETRIYREDLHNLIKEGSDRRGEGGRSFEQLPSVLRKATLAWRSLAEDQRETFVTHLSTFQRADAEQPPLDPGLGTTLQRTRH